MENVIIRKVRKEDLLEVVNIQINGWKTAYQGIIEEEYLQNMNQEERLKKKEEDYKKKDGFIVAELSNHVVGFCRYIDNNSYSQEVAIADCELLALYVRVDLKRHGIGKKLFDYVKKEFHEKNKEKMILWCLKENEPSKRFYEKMGGRVIKERSIAIGEKEYLEVCFLYDI